MLAVSRKARVKGRISVLRDSTKTRNGARKSGAPLGINAPRTFAGELEIPVIIRPVHSGRARGKVIAR
jgi:hypothetical protein